MKAIVTATGNLAIREGPGTSFPAREQKLHKGDFVYGKAENGWIGFQRVYRFNGTVENVAGYCSTAFTAETDEVEPEYREVAHVLIVFTNGDVLMDERRVVDAVKAAL